MFFLGLCVGVCRRFKATRAEQADQEAAPCPGSGVIAVFEIG